MAIKTHCEARIETVNAKDGIRNLVITVPFDVRPLINTMRNTPRDKKSVTLVDSTVCAAVNSRGSESLYVDIQGYRVELKGGVNLYCALPSGLGTTSVDQARLDREAARIAAEKQAADDIDWTVLSGDLIDKHGELLREKGDRIMRTVLSDFVNAGCTIVQSETAVIPPKHPTLTDEEHNAIAMRATDSKLAELESAEVTE